MSMQFLTTRTTFVVNIISYWVDLCETGKFASFFVKAWAVVGCCVLVVLAGWKSCGGLDSVTVRLVAHTDVTVVFGGNC